MRYIVCVSDGHHFRDFEIETDKGVEEACSLAMVGDRDAAMGDRRSVRVFYVRW
jgi:hypothetical protein